ncbi:MAG: AmmeMemoRadiSam system protein B [Clostridia bacterium]|nr:AmmeMemoRadiSam system protein B [Clostridia bacterium]
MGKIIHGSLVPHPPIIVPEIGGSELSKVKDTVDGMKKFSESLKGLDPDALVIISPHAPVIEDAVAVNQIPILRGDFGSFSARGVNFEVENDLDLSELILDKGGELGLPMDTINANLLRASRTTSILDHGIMVPLYYLREAGLDCPLVPISISFQPLKDMYLFGMAVKEAVEAAGRNVAIIASGDLSHRLLPSAPSGYAPEGILFDEKIRQTVEERDPMILLNMSDEFIHKAGQCGLRPLLMLLGAFEGRGLDSVLHSYEGPFGVGYMVAEFFPTGCDSEREYAHKIFGG